MTHLQLHADMCSGFEFLGLDTYIKNKERKSKGGIWWSPLLPKGQFIAFNLKALAKLLLQ